MGHGQPILTRIRLELVLVGSRDRGESFPCAWSSALSGVQPNAEARVILASTPPAWRRAYLGSPATAGDRAAGELADALDREPIGA